VKNAAAEFFMAGCCYYQITVENKFTRAVERLIFFNRINHVHDYFNHALMH